MTEPACFHCGNPCPDPAAFPIRYRGAVEPTCCAGCQAVAETILQSGLESYYSQRTQPADRSEPLPAEIREQIQLYDDTALQKDFVFNVDADVREAALIIEGITCAACIWLNEQHLTKLPGIQAVSINYTTHRARVRWDNSQIQLSTILQHIAAIGYRAQPYDHARDEANWQQQRKSALFRLWVAGLSMMQVMMFVVPIYMAPAGEIDPVWLSLMHWGSAILTLPVVLYSCLPFYRSSWRDLKQGRAGMDLPVSLGVLIAFFASLYSLLTGHGDIYFDSVSMFVFLLLAGRYLEMQARRKAGAAAEMLVRLIPAFAHRLDAEGQSAECAVSQLEIGDRILVKAGETIPADGTVYAGESEVSEAMLSGESMPIAKQAGSTVTGGTLNLHSPLQIQISKIGEGTRLASMVRLLDQAMQQKPRIALLADRVAGWFVLALLLVAAGTFAYWHLHDPQHALPITVAVLVISCPCALSLATPAALTVATGQLARSGLLTTKATALEALAEVSDIVFDKTGTLTYGQLHLTRTQVLTGNETTAIAIAAAIEHHSEHPIAQAFTQTDGKVARDVIKHPGGGLTAVVDQTAYILGSTTFVSQTTGLPLPANAEKTGTGTLIALASTTHWIALFELGDTLRPESPHLIHTLQQMGKKLHILSGDRPEAVAAVANHLGISTWHAGATPEEKVRHLAKLQQQGARVLMVGDGVNDAAVLARADVSIAMGGGVDIAQAAGDLVLSGNQLSAIPSAIGLAQKTRGIVRQNLAWALLYNAAALPLAAAGLITPWLASLGMAASSLLVVCNALRIRGVQFPQTPPDRR